MNGRAAAKISRLSIVCGFASIGLTLAPAYRARHRPATGSHGRPGPRRVIFCNPRRAKVRTLGVQDVALVHKAGCERRTVPPSRAVVATSHLYRRSSTRCLAPDCDSVSAWHCGRRTSPSTSTPRSRRSLCPGPSSGPRVGSCGSPSQFPTRRAQDHAPVSRHHDPRGAGASAWTAGGRPGVSVHARRPALFQPGARPARRGAGLHRHHGDPARFSPDRGDAGREFDDDRQRGGAARPRLQGRTTVPR